MLKWTVTKTPAPEANSRRRCANSEAKKRRSAPNGGDKENCFTSTPIKSSENHHKLDALRDVSNLVATPKMAAKRRRRVASTPSARKKKKRHLGPLDGSDTSFFQGFEQVDTHIKGLYGHCECPVIGNLRVYAPTLPTFDAEDSPCLLHGGDNHLNSLPLLLNFQAPPPQQSLQIGPSRDETQVSVSPLVKRLVDLRFSKISFDTTIKTNNSSYINELSIDDIVDAILERSGNSTGIPQGTTVAPEEKLKLEDEFRDKNPSITSSLDSGFNSTNTKKSNCNENSKYTGISCDKTIIDLSDTFNERCVDETNRKRSYSDSESLEKSLEFTLKRQKCIRRRRSFAITDKQPTNEKIASSQQISNASSTLSNLDRTYVTQCNKSALQKRTRRCLSFDSPSLDEKVDESRISTPKTNPGLIFLSSRCRQSELLLKVLKCEELSRPINAYVKIILQDKLLDLQRKPKKILERTPVQANSFKPTFNHTFRIPIRKKDINRKLIIEVWHRDRLYRRSEFLGCTSFSIKNVIKKDINGSYPLLPQSTGRSQNSSIAKLNLHSSCSDVSPSFANLPDFSIMDDSQTLNEEAMSIDDFDTDLKKSSNHALINHLQKDADENLFLRYLELDPTEGPDAIPAALQRKATGNKNGRTPFTTTKKLVRTHKGGFGFSVVWTHPPRIERVEKGLPADRGGILPGDYLIFVDKHNVVTMPEIEILNLIKSLGNYLHLEIFRRNSSRNGSALSVRHPSSTSGLPLVSCLAQHRPSTVCSTNTASAECSRRKLNLPQVTFNAEKTPSDPEEAKKKTMLQLLSKEQHYCTSLQFAIARFVSPLVERKDLITPNEHRTLFQNCEEILRITEDILDTLIQDDGEPQINLITCTYHSKLNEITSAYKRYCSGIKKADCVLVNKTMNSNSEFVRFLNHPAVPRRRPDITVFIHKPLEHYMEVLKSFNVLLTHLKTNHDEYALVSKIINHLQVTYREFTSEAGLMEPVGEGRPLLSVQDLENRLVFTKCKPFVLSKPGRQWIFGGDLTRVEGRSVRQYWTLLFSDLLLFAKFSRDRVLFIIEDPLPLINVTDLVFNVRKKATEFRIILQPGGRNATSPTVHCGPDLTRTPRKNANKRCVVLRAPTTELKAVWQNLLQRQIFHVNLGMESNSFSSPLESPEAPITSSVVTLQSADSLSIRRQNSPYANHLEAQKQIDEIVKHKCTELGKCSNSSKSNAIHLEQWIKGQLGADDLNQTPDDEPDCGTWTEEMLRKRTKELNLIDNDGNDRINANKVEELNLSDCSPSKSTSPESQVTVRSSPLVPESIPVCKQCRKTCLPTPTTTNIHHYNNNVQNNVCNSRECSTKDNNLPINTNQFVYDEFGCLMLLGLSAANPAASLVRLDPFSPIPKISVVPPTPNLYSEQTCKEFTLKESYIDNHIADPEFSPEDSPQDEEQPYHSLSSSNITLRRFGTVSSLEKLDTSDFPDIQENSSEDESDCGIDNQAFNNSTIKGWTARAGAFVSEKMAFFEKLGEDYRAGTGFFERYLKSVEVERSEEEECEHSGATSGDEIWGTPTSGGELDDPLSSSNYDGLHSPNADSTSSDNGDETELMMDELLMTPPITASAIRGLLPRRTLEPLMEEDSDNTCTSSSSTTTEEVSSPKQGSGTGDAADDGSTAARGPTGSTITEVFDSHAAASQVTWTVPRIQRSDSYRHIIEDEDDHANFFNRFKLNSKILQGDRSPRSKRVKLLEIFYVRKHERKIHETFPEGNHLLKVFSKEGVATDAVPTSYTQKQLLSRKPKDKEIDGRFWRQLSRRRSKK